MSINSKAKRDARKKRASKPRAERAEATLQTHARICLEGDVVGGGGWQSGEWVLILRGRQIASTDSAAMLLAMLNFAVANLEREGSAVSMSYSSQLEAKATAEAATAGKTLADYLDLLEEERKERLLQRAATRPAAPAAD